LALERRLLCGLARHAKAVGIVTGGDFDGGGFRLGKKGLQCEHSVERFAAVAEDVTSGGADLGVRVTVERLLDEIDEPGFALQGGQEREGFATNGRFRSRLGGHGRYGFAGRLWFGRRRKGGRIATENSFYLFRNGCVSQSAEKRSERESQTHKSLLPTSDMDVPSLACLA